MDTIVSKLTVFFDDPFWVGVCEREWDGRYEACKITFGSEPKDYEVYEFLLLNWYALQFSPSIEASDLIEKRINPKRMQRSISRQLQNTGVSTKAQQALKLQQEQGKQTRKVRSREEREVEKNHRFALRKEKHKEKHRGH